MGLAVTAIRSGWAIRPKSLPTGAESGLAARPKAIKSGFESNSDMSNFSFFASVDFFSFLLLIFFSYGEEEIN
jgi:hypothetical protein